MFYFFIFILGLLVGSFLNVLILRFGFYEAKRSRSACQACHSTLTWKDLIPVFSYMFLSGKCRTCGSSLSVQYPLVELGTATLFLFTALQSSPVIGLIAIVSLLLLFGFWSAFIVLTVYDLKHTLVPLVFVGVVGTFGMLLRLTETYTAHALYPLIDGALGGLLLAFFIGAIVLVTQERGMGVGDIYVAGTLGIFFGVAKGIEVLTLAFWIGAIVGVSLVGVSFVIDKFHSKGKSITTTEQKLWFRMKSTVPFVPFMFIAALIGTYTNFSPFLFVSSITQILWP